MGGCHFLTIPLRAWNVIFSMVVLVSCTSDESGGKLRYIFYSVFLKNKKILEVILYQYTFTFFQFFLKSIF